MDFLREGLSTAEAYEKTFDKFCDCIGDEDEERCFGLPLRKASGRSAD